MSDAPMPELTREQLYERVWDMPLQRLAEEFGISDVALAKRCRKLNIPTPPRGYWAKLEAGKRVKKRPLPVRLSPGEVQLDADAPVTLKASTSGLCAVANQLLVALRAADPDQQGLSHVRSQPELPDASVTKGLISSAARVCDAIVRGMEARGFLFKKARSRYDSGYFEAARQRIHLSITEPIETVSIEPTEKQKRLPSWEWQRTEQRSAGKLTLTLSSTRDYTAQFKETLTEEKTGSLEALAVAAVEKVVAHYRKLKADAADQQAKWEQQRTDYAAQEVERKKQEHVKNLEATARSREKDLFRAAEWWRIQRNMEDFIAACEQRWRDAGQLNEQSLAWLTWARETVARLSPFSAGYPDPARDGAVNAVSVPEGGPYPAKRGFPRPPTMPKPAPAQPTHYGYSEPKPEPYPFWLMNRR